MNVKNQSGRHRWHGRLRQCGFRMTVGREVVLQVLSHTDEHLSAEDIYMIVHKTHPAIGLTTVYRTLDMLVNMGAVFKFDFGDGRSRYELVESSRGPNHHHHLVCTQCKRIINYKDFIDDEVELLNRTEKGLSEKYNFEITNHEIQFFGICNECKNKDK